MNGMNELITVAHYWREWRDPRLIVLVLNNRDLNMVTWEQRILEGDRKFEALQDLPDFYAAYAQSITWGVSPRRLAPHRGRDRGCAGSRSSIRARGRCDRNVPPLPPHVSARQIRNYLVALAKGDSDAV